MRVIRVVRGKSFLPSPVFSTARANYTREDAVRCFGRSASSLYFSSPAFAICGLRKPSEETQQFRPFGGYHPPPPAPPPPPKHTPSNISVPTYLLTYRTFTYILARVHIHGEYATHIHTPVHTRTQRTHICYQAHVQRHQFIFLCRCLQVNWIGNRTWLAPNLLNTMCNNNK